MQKANQLDSFLRSQAKRPVNLVKDSSNEPEFAVSLSTSDPEDAKWNFRDTMLENKQNNALKNMEVIAPDSYFDYLQRKKEAELLGDYEAWVYANVDLSKPETQQFWYNAIPWLQEKRIQVIKDQAAIQERIAVMQVKGIKTEDDMKFLFAVKNGLVPISQKPLHKLNEDKEDNPGFLTKDFQAGLLNPYTKFFIQTPLTTSEARTNSTIIEEFKYTDPFTIGEYSRNRNLRNTPNTFTGSVNTSNRSLLAGPQQATG